MSVIDRFQEKAVIARAFFHKDIESAVVKATKRNSKPLKWKHVSIVLNATFIRDKQEELHSLLLTRVQDGSWSVVFKTLILIHLILQDGAEMFRNTLCRSPNSFNVIGFKDVYGLHIEQRKNITNYASYLSCRMNHLKRFGKDALLDVDATNGMELMDSLLQCKYLESEIDNNVTMHSFKLLVSDVSKLIANISKSMIQNLKNPTNDTLKEFKRFYSQQLQVESMLHVAKNLGMDVFELKKVPDISHLLPNGNQEPRQQDIMEVPQVKANFQEINLLGSLNLDQKKNPFDNLIDF